MILFRCDTPPPVSLAEGLPRIRPNGHMRLPSSFLFDIVGDTFSTGLTATAVLLNITIWAP